MRKDVADWLRRKLILDKSSVDEMKAFDDMADMKWDLPAGLARLNYAVKYIDPVAHDAEKTATNFFDTYQPKIDILPRGPEDKDRAEELERFLEWHMTRANNGETEPFRTMLKRSVRYNRVCAQLDYLPYWLPRDRSKWTDEQREAVAYSPFCIYVPDTKTIHYEMGKYGLPSKVAVISNSSIADVVAHWGIYPGIHVDELQKWLDKEPLSRVIYVDYTDRASRYVCAWRTGSGYDIDAAYPTDADIFDGKPSGHFIEIYNGANELGFINWTIQTGSSDALFAALHRGDLWVNANRTESIKRSDLYRRAFYPMGIEEGQSSEEIEVDYTGDTWTYKVPMGKKLTPIIRPPIDPGWSQLASEDRAILSRTTGVETLGATEPKSNVQFATINMFYQMSLTNLRPYIRTAEKGIAGLCGMVFKWIKLMGEPEVGRRMYAAGENKVAGSKITVSPQDFTPETLYINVELVEDNPTGKLQMVNMIGQLIQAGLEIPNDEFIPKLGYGNAEALRQRWEKQQVRKLALQNFGQKLQLQLQIEAQAAMQPQGPGAQPSDGQPVIPGGNANNPAMGGNAPAEAAPEMTQTQLPQEGM